MPEKMRKGASVPLYQQVMDDIRSDIDAGAYRPGVQIPTEFELAGAYGVGRVTVRRAIEELVCEGYLTKQQGRGTFVNAPKLMRKVKQEGDVQSFSDACAVNGMEATARVISVRTVPAAKDMASFFGLPGGSDLIVVERLRLADGVPVMLENNFFPRDGFAFLNEVSLDGAVSIFDEIRSHTGRHPESSRDCTLEIARADAEAAAHLAVPMGEPLFYMKVDFLDADGLPLLSGRQYIVGSRFVFSF